MILKKERIKILTESYKRLVEANIPFVARSLVDYLRNILSGSGEKRIDKHVYLKMKRRDMYLAFQEYAKQKESISQYLHKVIMGKSNR